MDAREGTTTWCGSERQTRRAPYRHWPGAMCGREREGDTERDRDRSCSTQRLAYQATGQAPLFSSRSHGVSTNTTGGHWSAALLSVTSSVTIRAWSLSPL
ncbi:hypothetical protein RRG08_064143 [Elysia crispata]|uniref:Uncharacterized protein n=1 Tax=Elysia crispata TaxID=231223 RepID=A0AAE0ZM76_9GAST|nr:hypothetical protein RRG08_064143 [Elysia crispata]